MRRFAPCIQIFGFLWFIWPQLALASFDQDGDGITDADDNCIYVANPQQTDSNGDGIGNSCDADLNNDGIVDNQDYDTYLQFVADNNLDADLTGDGLITDQDRNILLSWTGFPPGPADVADTRLYQRPRLLTSDQHFAYLATRLETYPYSKFWSYIEASARIFAGELPPCPLAEPDCGAPNSVADYDESSIRSLAIRLPFMAMAYRLTGETLYLEGARKWMDALVSYQDWASNSDIGAATILIEMSTTYDWLYDSFSAAERQSYRNKMVYHANIMHGLLIAENSIWWKYNYYSNHNYTNVLSLVFTAIALYGEVAEADDWLEAAQGNHSTVLSLLSPDGATVEGAHYWALEMMRLLPYYLAIYPFDTQQGEQGLRHGFFRNAAMFRLYASTPGYFENVNFSDSTHHDQNSTHSLRGLACIYSDARAQWLAERIDAARESRGEPPIHYWLNMLWYCPGVPETPPDDLPLYRYFDNMGILIARSSWNDDAFWSFHKSAPYQGYVAEAAGFYPGSHTHPDEGQFLAWSQGRWLLIDDGYVNLKRTENHNVLLFNNSGQLGSDKQWFDAFEVFQNGGTVTPVYSYFADDVQYMVTELASMYRSEADVLSWQRSFVGLAEGYQVIRDDVILNNAGQIDSLVHAEFASRLINGDELLLNPRDTVPEAFDRSGNGNDGAVTGAYTIPGISGNALYFIGEYGYQLSGIFDKVAFPSLNRAAFPASGSLSLWLHSDNFAGQKSTPVFDRAAASRNHIYIRTSSGTPTAPLSGIEVGFQSQSGGASVFLERVNLAPNQWHHVVVTWDTQNDLGQLYVDNELVRSDVISDAAWTPDDQLVKIGNGFIGSIDELKLYDRVLDAAEVGALYRLEQVNADLAGSWSFDGIDAGVKPGYREYSYRLIHPAASTADESAYLIPPAERFGAMGKYIGRQLSHAVDSPGTESMIHFVGDAAMPVTYDAASNAVTITRADYTIEIDFDNRSIKRVALP